MILSIARLDIACFNVAGEPKRVTHLFIRGIWKYRFGQANDPNGGSVLGSRQVSILPQLTPKILLDSKVVEINTKIIISHC